MFNVDYRARLMERLTKKINGRLMKLRWVFATTCPRDKKVGYLGYS